MLFPGNFMDCIDEDQSLIDISMTSSCDEHHQTLIKKQSMKQEISGKFKGGFQTLLETEIEELRQSQDNKFLKGSFGVNGSQLRSTLQSNNPISQLGFLQTSVASQNSKELKSSIRQSQIKANINPINSLKIPVLNYPQINSPKTPMWPNQFKSNQIALRIYDPIKDSQIKNSNTQLSLFTSLKPDKIQQNLSINIIQPQESKQTPLVMTSSIVFEKYKSSNINWNSSQQLGVSNNLSPNRLSKTENKLQNYQIYKKYTSGDLLQSSAIKKLKLRDYIELDKLNGKRKKERKNVQQINTNKQFKQSETLQIDKNLNGTNDMKSSSIFSTRRNSSGSDVIGSKLKAELKNNIRNLQQCLRKTLERVDCVNNQGQNKQEQMMVIFTLGKIIKENMMKGGNELEKYLSQTDN